MANTFCQHNKDKANDENPTLLDDSPCHLNLQLLSPQLGFFQHQVDSFRQLHRDEYSKSTSNKSLFCRPLDKVIMSETTFEITSETAFETVFEPETELLICILRSDAILVRY